MNKPTKRQPHNPNCITVQLDEKHAEIFFRVQRASGQNITQTAKNFLYPALEEFDRVLRRQEAKLIDKIFRRDESIDPIEFIEPVE